MADTSSGTFDNEAEPRFKALRESDLEQLSKEQLVQLVIHRLADSTQKVEQVYAFLSENGAVNSISDRVAAFKESIDEEIADARAAAQKKVGKKYHLIDEANPTVEVVGEACDRYRADQVMLEAPLEVRLDILLYLLESLTCFSAEGSIYDFDGNDVAESIDSAVCDCLDADGADALPLELLQKISDAFRGDAPAFISKQAYGLFGGLSLLAGARAAEILGGRRAGGSESGSKKRKRAVNGEEDQEDEVNGEDQVKDEDENENGAKRQDVDGKVVSKAVRAVLRKQTDPTSVKAKELRQTLETKLGCDLSEWKQTIKDAALDFIENMAKAGV